MSDTGPGDFVCEAYGPDGLGFGAICFLQGDTGKRVCASLAECHQVMTGERQRVFRLINEKAAGGDPDMEYLAGEFSRPEQLLGGGEEDGSA